MNEAGNILGVSFIIPTYNAGVRIESCLKSIREQDYPQENIEIIISDGGSMDNTLGVAEKYNCRIINNPRRLAEYGVQLGIQKATGKFLVVFAADNELVGDNWVSKVINVFNKDKDISAVWGRLASGKGDSSLNKYFELIQSDPLNWFLNRNLNKYIRQALLRNGDCYIFRVNPRLPLVWGANGLVYRTERIKAIWEQDGYLGDNDAFQCMIEQGDDKVAYFNIPFVYHHHVSKIGDWLKKWKRNFLQHLLDKKSTRNMNWLFTKSFKIKLMFWVIYSAIPILSVPHTIYLSIKNRNIYWFYHPFISFLQLYTYVTLIIFNRQGLRLLLNLGRYNSLENRHFN